MAKKTLGLTHLSNNLAPLFGDVSPTFLTDSLEVVAALRASGVPASHFDEMNGMSKVELANVVMLPIQFNRTPSGKFIEEKLGQSAMLAIPIASFCGTDQGALYFLEMLSSVDFERCVAGVTDWLDCFSVEPSVRMAGFGTDISVVLDDEVYLMSPKATMVIQPGEWVSIAQFLEVGLIGHSASARPRHRMDGTLVAEGFVVAHHRYAAPYVGELCLRTWAFLQSVRRDNNGAPLVMEVRDSQPVSLKCGDDEILAPVREFTTNARSEFVGEFAFAADNHFDLSTVDWGINSQLNEAIGGLHIGLGNGVAGAHIDFVAPRAVMQQSG